MSYGSLKVVEQKGQLGLEKVEVEDQRFNFFIIEALKLLPGFEVRSV